MGGGSSSLLGRHTAVVLPEPQTADDSGGARQTASARPGGSSARRTNENVRTTQEAHEINAAAPGASRQVGAATSAGGGDGVEILSAGETLGPPFEWQQRHVVTWAHRLQHIVGPKFSDELKRELVQCEITTGALLLALSKEERLAREHLPLLRNDKWTAHIELLMHELKRLQTIGKGAIWSEPHQNDQGFLRQHFPQPYQAQDGMGQVGARHHPVGPKRQLSVTPSLGRGGQHGPVSTHGAAVHAVGRRPPMRRTSKLLKPKAVISYNPAQSKFKEFVLVELRNMGFDTWCRTKEQGSDSPTEEWITQATTSETLLVVFVLSGAYVKSELCMKEFRYIMQDSRSKMVVPLLFDDCDKSVATTSVRYFLSKVNFVRRRPFIKYLCDEGCSAEESDCKTHHKVDVDPMKDGALSEKEWLPKFKRAVKVASGRADIELDRAFVDKEWNQSRKREVVGAEDGARPQTAGEEKKDDRGRTDRLLQEDLLAQIAQDMSSEEVSVQPGDLRLVGIIGSVDFHSDWTKDICIALARELARAEPTLTLVTGGFDGVGETMARAFSETRAGMDMHHGTYSVLPETDPDLLTSYKGKADIDEEKLQFKEKEYGKTIFIGHSVKQRERLMAVNPVMIILEGGGGAQDEALYAINNGRYVIPISITGGKAAECKEICEEQLKPDLGEEFLTAWGTVREISGKEHNRTNKNEKINRIVDAARTLVTSIHESLIQGSYSSSDQLLAGGLPSESPAEYHPPPKLDNILQRISREVESEAKEHRMASFLEKRAQHMYGESTKLKAPPVYILNGHRGHSKFKTTGGKVDTDILEQLDEIAEALNKHHGLLDLKEGEGELEGFAAPPRARWMCVYGGDPYVPGTPNVAHLARQLREKHGVPILALHPNLLEDKILKPKLKETYEHLAHGALYSYPTELVPEYKEGSSDKDSDEGPQWKWGRRILYGGYNPLKDDLQDLTPCASSAVYFNGRLLQKHLRGHIVVGGGQDARDDCQECQLLGIPTRLVQAEHVPNEPPEMLKETADFQEVYGKYGVVHEYVTAWGPFFSHCFGQAAVTF